ncbi:cytochrome P450 3A8-like [Centruroides sculpturatus]|uniref:cytochrome P450 3A8-like n=1 Tax=Centruroides sculpturatus TaxID=218467 RepID=UPI000C6E8484|nr:cytochrome P450 3A8-like [Centruroides sculpturatus]XP_023212170.1 cytochrome P450 3A8-like [Centruroides sculpturatus]XP_023212171.1 cytochrome P450 3A8-like [Centruroides sculpturatus]
MNISITIAAFICIILLWIRWRKQKMTLFQRYRIPGPKPNFIFGNLIEFNKGRDRCIEKWLQQYGKLFGFYLGAKPFLVCSDVELLKLLQIKDTYNFYNRDLVLPAAGLPHVESKNMLIALTDQKWKNLRSILSSCFTTGKIKMMSALMSSQIKFFLKNVEKQGDQPFDILKLCKKLAFDIICTSAFGVSTNVQNNETNKFVESAHAAFSADSADILAVITISFPEIEPICTFLRYKIDTLKYMLNLPSLSLIYETCQKVVTFRKKLDSPPQDLLQTIIDAEDETIVEMKKLPDNFVIVNAVMFMATGFETTSAIIGWCIKYLAGNPKIQQNVREEITNNVSEDVDIQYSDLINFKLLDQVISETLRFWPLSLLPVNRICSEDYRYKDMTIPKGSIIAIPVKVLQSDPAHWSEPDKFNPYRFSSKERKKVDSLIYQPFGAGHRMCIGQRLAKTIIKLVLANLIRSFKLEEYGDDEDERVYAMFFNYPKNGVMVKATPSDS